MTDSNLPDAREAYLRNQILSHIMIRDLVEQGADVLSLGIEMMDIRALRDYLIELDFY